MVSSDPPDKFDAQQAQHNHNIPRRPHMVSPDAVKPAHEALFDTPTPPNVSSSLDISTQFPPPTTSSDQRASFAASSTESQSPYPSTPVPPPLSAASMASPPQSALPVSKVNRITEEPASSLIVPPRSSLSAYAAQMVQPPSLNLPSIQPRPTSPPESSFLDLNEEDMMDDDMPYEHAIDFAMQSWDLATGGLKTMTAKRELPVRQDRKSLDLAVDESLERTTRNYTFALIILACVILMLLGSGVVLFVVLQH